MTRLLWLTAACLLPAAPAAAQKRESVFFPQAVRERARVNAARYDWAARIRARAVADAARWLRLSDQELWDSVFGATITRSHMVWSSGYCPACRQPMPMYDWEIDAFARPWKVRCQHCNQLFPKNDFEQFYRSGLDERAVFDPRRANGALLFNTEHPDAGDVLHGFGVDDGEGYVEGDKRWRFIGAYLQYGQFRQKIEAGVRNLATAYTVTGDRVYAHKAGVLLDRLADVWPTFDFASQGLVYERARYGGGVAGYVTYAIDSAGEVRELVSAYDKVFDAIRDDTELVRFLRKRSFAEVQKNIEDRILRHALDHPLQIRTNYPGTERTQTLIRTVLEWPRNRAELRATLGEIAAKATAVDGLSGEKGLASYATIAPRALAEILEEYARLDPGLVGEVLERNPKLRETYRFHVDTWIGREFYPNSGDSGSFGKKQTQYAGLTFPGEDSAAAVSPYSFLARMWKATGDPLYLQLAWNGNGRRADGLPHDIFADDPAHFAAEVKAAVEKHGDWPKVGSVNKREWRIAILRHSTEPGAAVWLDYDSVPEGALKSHYHYDAMNLGLFARGVDLLPEFGYPAVQFGDWHTPQALWHKKTAAHNTVVVDGKDQAGGAAEATLWRAGGPFQVIRASSPAQIKGAEYERTVAMVETGPRDFYAFDVFRVAGGKEHAKVMHTALATPSPFGLRLEPAEAFWRDTLMRNFRTDRAPGEGWGVDFRMSDDLHLRYTDLTRGAEGGTAESWTVESMTSTVEYWAPTVVTRRRAESSTFVSLLDPHERMPQLKRITRLDREGEAVVKVEVELVDGRRDLMTSGLAGVTWERRDARGTTMERRDIRR